MTDPSLRISPLTVDDLLPALGLLYSHLSPGDAVAMAAGGIAQIEREPALLQGFFGAFRGDELIGSVWSQVQAGRIVMLNGPAAAASESPAVRAALLAPAEEHARKNGATLLQALIADADDSLLEFLLANDYQEIAGLAYLVSLAESFPTTGPPLDCSLEPFAEHERPRLARLLDATYAETLDCPALNGARESRDVIEGYQSGGSYSPERWFFVRDRDADVGCLLLNDYPDHDQWELVYVGLAPSVRGRGWGLDLTRHAQWLARQAGRARLVLAVDESNAPALRMYASAGFVVWNRRTVLCKSIR